MYTVRTIVTLKFERSATKSYKDIYVPQKSIHRACVSKFSKTGGQYPRVKMIKKKCHNGRPDQKYEYLSGLVKQQSVKWKERSTVSESEKVLSV